MADEAAPAADAATENTEPELTPEQIAAQEEKRAERAALVGHKADSVLVPARYGFAPEQVQAIKQTIMPENSTDAELVMLLEVAGRYELDPFAKQIYAARIQGGISIIVSRDGLLAHAHRSADFRGLVGDVVCKNDTFKVTSRNGERVVIHEYDMTGNGDPATQDEPGRGPILGAWAMVKRDGHDPYFFFAPWEEYYREARSGRSTPWQTHPSAMILKCFTPDTEVLTTHGYEPITMITGEVLQVTDSGLEPVKVEPFVQEFDGELVEADGRDLNFAVTPEHRMVTEEDGVIRAEQLYAEARRRAKHHVPLVPPNDNAERVISDEQIALAAAYVADGFDYPGSPNRIGIEVSREAKVSALAALGIEVRAYGRAPGASPAATSRAKHRRAVVTRTEKAGFGYHRALVERLVGPGKEIKIDALLTLSRRQARLFVDTWLAFDGDAKGRLYTSRPDHAAAVEVVAALAGYAVSPRRERTSDIGTKPNYVIGISPKQRAPIVKGDSAPQGLLRRPYSGPVWCLTVPSGKIMVRRRGKAMVCGQCAETYALRKAYSVSGVVGEEEIDRAEAIHVQNLSEAPQEDFGDDELGEELRQLVEQARQVDPGSWRPVKVRGLLDGADDERRREIRDELKALVDGEPVEAEVVG